ncbi:ferrous iron transporter B [Cryobacterium sp. MDB2-33-2]|uniref:ferrous iron transporter B n=1 Tax=Cryobacterium sp. MDB2-33-2 TaxID=1259179 RepID=UPI001069985F|nr:ferrous iron transporter B [Cryobacterium sp. MDB2-33-2]TFC02961.1 ferrous iron transporter B [Cryobacterium sp. MDB2-33-2]
MTDASSGQDCHGGPTGGTVVTGAPRTALVGSPNAGKTSIFNALTGLRAKTGNYPGVTVGRSVGVFRSGGQDFVVEDLPGTYGLEPVSPDEQIVTDLLQGRLTGVESPDALVVVIDATTLWRSLRLVSQVLRLHRPVCIAVTLTDELITRGGRLDIAGLERALGVPVVRVIGNRRIGIPELRTKIAGWRNWSVPVLDPPTDPAELEAWTESILLASEYRPAQPDKTTQRIDAVLLHPVWGTAIFIAVMVTFFQIIFSFAAPLQGLVETFFGWLAGLVDVFVPVPWLAGLLGDAIIGGVGAVVVFIPQIMLMFLLISLLEGVGYMCRAAFLMDRIMSRAGLEGRAFVALMSSFACAVPGIMATRTLPSAKDRIATMMGAPLMTCSARLPVYILLIGMLVSPESRIGPLQTQGVIMFCLYFLGAVSAMLAAWIVKTVQDRNGLLMPFYMEMPPYRVPTLRSICLTMWDSSRAFLRKCGTIVMLTTIVLWLLLNFPLHSTAELTASGVDVTDEGAVTSFVMDHSAAASIGRAVEPVFAPLGFDWRVNIGVVASLSARETFVATLGQIAAADDPDNPSAALSAMTYTDGAHAGDRVFTAPTIAALLVFFVYALQCMSTVSVMKRETGTWKWPAIAFGYMFVLAWSSAWIVQGIVALATGTA